MALSLSILMFGALALVPALASAKTPTPALEIGPFKTKGYTFDLLVGKCSGTSVTDITYSKGTAANAISYFYSGKGTCSAAASLKGVKLKLSWPGVATINVKAGASGAAKRAKTPTGCRGGRGTSRDIALTGSIDIHAAKAFGTLKSHHVKATVARISDLNCKALSHATGTNLFAAFGKNQFIEASLPKRGSRDILLSDQFAPTTGVTGSMLVQVAGTSKQFKLVKGAGALTNLKPFAAGKLTLSELPVCIGSKPGAQNVTLGGQITVNSPVLGKVRFSSSAASTTYISTGSAFPGQCNGYGSMPLTPAVDNTCSMDGVCSLMYATNNDMFYDDSMLGTQTIVSETIDFGDGTTGTFANGTVSHTYASPGTYTATVTIETSNGQTQTTTTPVYIDS
jgi:hypothetical protein